MGRFDDYTSMGGSKYYFQTTHWSLIDAVRSPDKEQRIAALEHLIGLYWKPVYCYLRRRNYNNDDAKDLTQEFFLSGIKKEKFKRADPTRGRFRTFLLKCLGNFIINFERDKKARGRQPSKPIVSIDQFDTTEVGIELFHTETPEDSFNRSWVQQLLLRVLKSLEKECLETGKDCHFKLFQRRIIKPILEGIPQPPIKELAKEMGLTEKQACNYVVTARRA